MECSPFNLFRNDFIDDSDCMLESFLCVFEFSLIITDIIYQIGSVSHEKIKIIKKGLDGNR